jgi:CheY-like chemotaxis protein
VGDAQSQRRSGTAGDFFAVEEFPDALHARHKNGNRLRWVDAIVCDGGDAGGVRLERRRDQDHDSTAERGRDDSGRRRRSRSGTIWVYSEPNIGTSFKVYLPRVDELVRDDEPVTPTKRSGGSETILLVEDEVQLRSVARVILRGLGYKVLEATDVADALGRCERHNGTIDLLLTDVVMPEMSGPELAKHVTQMRPSVKVLCMSGYTDDAMVRHGAISACGAYLQKPITPDKLARKVREVLDAR